MRDAFIENIENCAQLMGDALDPCPFCGGIANYTAWYEKCADDSYIKYPTIYCVSCGAVMFGEKEYEDGEKIPLSEFEKLVESWNRRADHGND